MNVSTQLRKLASQLRDKEDISRQTRLEKTASVAIASSAVVRLIRKLGR